MAREQFVRARLNKEEGKMLEKSRKKYALANASETVRFLIRADQKETSGPRTKKGEK